MNRYLLLFLCMYTQAMPSHKSTPTWNKKHWCAIGIGIGLIVIYHSMNGFTKRSASDSSDE